MATMKSIGSEVVRLLHAAGADGKADVISHLHATPHAVPHLEDMVSLGDVGAHATLTEQELAWIVATRDAAAENLLPCTNVELVQLALITKGNTAKALSRLRKMAAWKMDLHLDDISFADAFRKVNAPTMTVGYGSLAPQGRAHSGSMICCAWYSVRLPCPTLATRPRCLC